MADECPHADQEHAIDVFLADGRPEYGPAMVRRDNHADTVEFCEQVMERGFRGCAVESVRAFRADNETYGCYRDSRPVPPPTPEPEPLPPRRSLLARVLGRG